MLVIDECGKYTLNPDLEKFLLSQIITSRYENNRPTVLVTNENKKKYIEFLGKSVFDRMTEVCITLDFTGKSKRQEFRK
jgi:DNA replication protein DnaC